MSNEVATMNEGTGTAIAETNVSNISNAFLGHTTREGVSSGVYMRHNGNTGKYIIGDKEIEGGTFVFDIMSARLAWLGFDPNNRPVNGPEVRMIEGKALPDAPATPGVSWNKQIKIGVVDIDSGSEILLSCKADKPFRAVWKLIKEYGEKVSRHPTAPMPLVECKSRSFQIEVTEEQKDGTQKKIKATKYSDVYEIVDWLSIAQVQEIKAMGAPAEDAPEDTTQPEVEILPPQKPAQTQPSSGATARSRFGAR